jgi:hypothetical protein
MKNIIKLSLLAAGLASAAYAQVPAGQTGLIAGWDFANTIASSSKSFDSLLTDTGTYGDYSTTLNNAGTFTSTGSFRVDGTKGSSTWLTTGAVGNRKALSVSGTDLDDGSNGYVINTYRRTQSTSVLYLKNFALNSDGGVYEDADGTNADSPAFYELRATSLINKFSFAFNSTGFQGVSMKFTGAQTGASASTINWSYSIDGGTNVSSLGSSSAISGGAVQYTVDLSAITGLNNNVDAVIIGQFAGVTSAQFDNVQILGTATAIPEPSAFAALAGVAALGLVAARRRRSAK